MKTMFPRFSPYAFALLRIMAGLMFMLHGTQKLFGLPPMKGGPAGPLPTIAIVAGIIEAACGFLIVIGFLTGIAAFLSSGLMAAAYFMAHAGQGFWPITNQGETAVLYCFLWLYVATHGAGVWSVDAMTGRRPAAGFAP